MQELNWLWAEEKREREAVERGRPSLNTLLECSRGPHPSIGGRPTNTCPSRPGDYRRAAGKASGWHAHPWVGGRTATLGRTLDPHRIARVDRLMARIVGHVQFRVGGAEFEWPDVGRSGWLSGGGCPPLPQVWCQIVLRPCPLICPLSNWASPPDCQSRLR